MTLLYMYCSLYLSLLQEKLPIETALIVRKHCACNYEAVVKCIYSEDNRTFLDQLHKILWILTTDPYCDIRKVIASSMRKVNMVTFFLLNKTVVLYFSMGAYHICIWLSLDHGKLR